MRYSERTMQILRKRENLKENDKSKDELFESYSSEMVFRELVAWEFGDPGWAGTIHGWLNQAGYEVKARYG